MTFHDYQILARRTQNPELTPRERLEHATWGLCAEVGEVCALHQKKHQGHILNQASVLDELSDCLWFIAELCDVYGFNLDEVAEHNIAKLRSRYKGGFTVKESVNRTE